jgi:hypothetical protein
MIFSTGVYYGTPPGCPHGANDARGRPRGSQVSNSLNASIQPGVRAGPAAPSLGSQCLVGLHLTVNMFAEQHLRIATKSCRMLNLVFEDCGTNKVGGLGVQSRLCAVASFLSMVTAR